MSKLKLNSEMIIAAAAMLTAIAAVVVSVIQTDIMRAEAEMEREHARLSVQPSVWIFQNTNTTEASPKYELALLNKGLGPAVIEQFEVTVDGEIVLRWSEIVSKISDGKFILGGEDANVGQVGFSSVPPGHIIPAEAQVLPIRIGNSLELVTLLASTERVNYSLCACSVYKECWRTKGRGDRPEPVKACETNRERYFRG